MHTLVVLVKILLTVLASVASQEITEQPLKKVNVAVYYEALGPESVKFFNEQLTPNLDIIDKYVDLKHVPFGRAKHEYVEGEWVSTCHHTPTECEGHKIQACSLLSVGSASLRNAFISCLMQRGDKNKAYPTVECSNEVLEKSDVVSLQAFKGCILKEEFEDKLEEFKKETNSLQPPLSFVPTIVFNGVYKQNDQDLALNDFKKVLCEYLEADYMKVPECAVKPAPVPDTHSHHPEHTITEQPLKKVNVAVYYEALCPDSVKFFNEQLTPHLDIIDKYVDLKHVPFGRAKHDMVNGEWVSTCSHTATECEGHAVQACGILHAGYESLRNAFISCLMQRGDKNKPYPTVECADKVQGSSDDGTLQTIKSCIERKEYELQIEQFKEETNALQPPLTSVPTIVFNGVFKQKDQDLALRNFAKVLCRYIEVNVQRVPECTAHSRAADSAVISSLLLTVVAVLAIAHF